MKAAPGLWLALIFGASPAFAAEPISLGVESSTLAADLAQALSLELGRPVVTPAGDAQLIVRLSQVADRLSLAVESRRGERLLDRELGLEGGTLPALRIAVVLVTQAVGDYDARVRFPVRTASVAAASERAPRPPERGPGIRLAASAQGSLWQAPGKPRFGPGASLGVEGRLGFVVLDLALADALARTSELEADVLELHASALLGLALVDEGRFQLFAFGGAGVSRYDGEAKALVFQGPATPAPIGFTSAQLSAGLESRIGLFSVFDVWLRGGLRFQLAAQTFNLPADFQATTREPISTGSVEPFLAAGLGAQIVSFL